MYVNMISTIVPHYSCQHCACIHTKDAFQTLLIHWYLQRLYRSLVYAQPSTVSHRPASLAQCKTVLSLALLKLVVVHAYRRQSAWCMLNPFSVVWKTAMEAKNSVDKFNFRVKCTSLHSSHFCFPLLFGHIDCVSQ